MRFLIIGGAGFIGCNLAYRLMPDGHQVIIVDDLSRPGSVGNLRWLRTKRELAFEKIDIRDYERLSNTVKQYCPDVIIHEAAQVAVTTSITNPRMDFEVNALGTFNLLELTRKYMPSAIFIFASTNKVYGKLHKVETHKVEGRYSFKNLPYGISEEFPLDFYSPYGCSKGAADQYVRDYSRIYNLKTVVFRQSCIYGPRQFGIEDQGWVAWFVIASVLGKSITICGDGKQVRDVLYIDDLIDAYLAVIENIDVAAGQIYNIGGGKENQLSLLELIHILETLTGGNISLSFDDWRAGDQLVFISDVCKAKSELHWEPKTDVNTGVSLLYTWVKENVNLVETTLTKIGK